MRILVRACRAEVLLAKDGVKVSRETLRKWMVEDGLWLSRKQRRSFHQPRLRRESYGELIQIFSGLPRTFVRFERLCGAMVYTNLFELNPVSPSAQRID
jgi:hypothetical protein